MFTNVDVDLTLPFYIYIYIYIQQYEAPGATPRKSIFLVSLQRACRVDHFCVWNLGLKTNRAFRRSICPVPVQTICPFFYSSQKHCPTQKQLSLANAKAKMTTIEQSRLESNLAAVSLCSIVVIFALAIAELFWFCVWKCFWLE